MRLICPNCDAQYEVPDEVIPADGRDVQCSNCGKTWFQHHPDFAPSPEEPGLDEAFVHEAETEQDGPGPNEDYHETPMDAPQRRELDPQVTDILRQEAERETAARQAEAASLETQPDLGLDTTEDESERRAREARIRMARMRGNDPGEGAEPAAREAVDNSVDEAAAAAALGSRRDLLPDIEEINSTLRSTGDREMAGGDPDPTAPVRNRKKRGFRRGFLFSVLFFVIALLIYIYAPQIAEAVPQTDPWLSGYVTWVDNLRVRLDGQVKGALTWLDQMADGSATSNVEDTDATASPEQPSE